jgi:hypothetical protein
MLTLVVGRLVRDGPRWVLFAALGALVGLAVVYLLWWYAWPVATDNCHIEYAC